ncbi:hypothetical protein B296_00001723, partial [Ensete ventricosum]
RGHAGYYLTARAGFRVGSAPSSNEGWKSRFFISYRRGWSFSIEWTSQMVNKLVPTLLVDETELVEILQRILSTSRGVKDMNEAWLAEAGLGPAPRGMFLLSAHCIKADSRSVASPTIGMSASATATESLAEKCPSVDEGLSLRKHKWRETPEHQANAMGSTTRCEVEDRVGAERCFATIMTWLKVAEGEDPLMPRWSVIAGSNQFWIKGPLSGEYLHGALHPTLAKQAYECSSEELMDRASKSTIWLEPLKTKRRRLEEEVGILRSSLDGARNDRARLEGDVLSLIEAVTLLKAELKGEGVKAVAAYKPSRGFESGLEKMGRVSYEFGYWVALERLRGKHPEREVEQDPFVECPEDANVKMNLSQPFDDSSPSEK